MISVKAIITPGLLQKLEALKNPKPLLRPVAFDVLAKMVERIHEKGEAADGSQIGTYNNQYLKLRKKKFKRSGDSKIIVSLTRKLENGWAVIASPRGWGIGFLDGTGTAKNPSNSQKLKFIEEVKRKKIGFLSAGEKQYAVEKLKKLINT